MWLTKFFPSAAPLSKLDRIQVPYLTGMKMVWKHTPYVWLVFGFLFSSLAFQVRCLTPTCVFITTVIGEIIMMIVKVNVFL